MDQNIEPGKGPDVQAKGTELEESIAYADSVKGRLTGTDTDRFIDLKKPEPVDNRTPREVVGALTEKQIDLESALREIHVALVKAGWASYQIGQELSALKSKQLAYDEALMKANAQISAGLPKYPKMLYGLDGRTFIAQTEAIHQHIEDHTRSWPNATKLGWFETPTERDDYAKAHGLL